MSGGAGNANPKASNPRLVWITAAGVAASLSLVKTSFDESELVEARVAVSGSDVGEPNSGGAPRAGDAPGPSSGR